MKKIILLALLVANVAQAQSNKVVEGRIYPKTSGGALFTPGSVPYIGAGGLTSQSNANIFWDSTNFRLGIGTASPTTALDVAGTIHVPSGAQNMTFGDSGTSVGNDGGNLKLNGGGGVYLASGAGNAYAFANPSDRSLLMFTANWSFKGLKLTSNTITGPLDNPDAASAAVTIQAGTNTCCGGSPRAGGDLVLQSGRGSLVDPAPNGSVILGNYTTERMRIDPDGEVGIGTTAPAVPLHIRKDSANARVDTLRLENTAGGAATAASLSFNWGQYISAPFVGQGNKPLQISVGDTPSVYEFGDGGELHIPGTTPHLRFSGSNAQAVISAQAGAGAALQLKVGGDVTTSQYDLQLTPSAAFTTRFTSFGDGGFKMHGTQNQTNDMLVVENYLGTDFFNIQADGDVGIGDTTPESKLEVAGMVRTTDVGNVPTTGAGLEIYYFSGTSHLLSYDRTGAASRPLILTSSLLTSSSLVDGAGGFRATGANTPASGEGLEIVYSGGISYLLSYDRTGSAWKPMTVNASKLTVDNQTAGNTLEVKFQGTERFRVESDGGTVISGTGGNGGNVLHGYERTEGADSGTTTCTDTCAGTEKVIGGGCRTTGSVTLLSSHPSSDTEWSCRYSLTGASCFATAICAQY